MKWTFKGCKHYSTEHMQKVEKQRPVKGLEKNLAPLRRGKQGKQCDMRYSI